jgi:arginyl-tRNA synthetase
MLKPVVEDLEQRGFIQDSDGAKCVFIPKQKVPLMVQKRDGGYNYDTTDMAALKYRVQE